MLSINQSNWNYDQQPTDFFQKNDLTQNLDTKSLKRKNTNNDIYAIKINEDKENLPPNSKNMILNANKTNACASKKRQRNVPSPSAGIKKVKRQYEPVSSAPSVMQDENDKIQGQSNPKLIKEHAYMRIQLFALAVVGLYGIAVRSDNTEDREFSLSFTSAYLQVGKASNSKGKVKVKNKFHAAHANAAAGYVDNSRERAIKTIADEHVITPNKKKRLTSKGFTDNDFKLIQESYHDFNKLMEIFDRVWPFNPLRPQSIFTGTSTDLILNSTTEVETGINLVVDKWIELLRPEIKQLYERIIYKKISQEEACIQYQNLIINHLLRFEEHHKKNSVNLVKYEEEFIKLEKYKDVEEKDVNKTQIEQITEILTHLRSLEKELNPPKKTQTNIEADPLSTTPKVKLPKNKKFLNNSLYALQNDTKNPISTLKIWMVKKFDVLKNEFQSQKEKIQAYIKFSEEERSGTVLPDFTALFGEFNPKTGIRELSFSSAQERSWMPLTTLKKSKLTF